MIFEFFLRLAGLINTYLQFCICGNLLTFHVVCDLLQDSINEGPQVL